MNERKGKSSYVIVIPFVCLLVIILCSNICQTYHRRFVIIILTSFMYYLSLDFFFGFCFYHTIQFEAIVYISINSTANMPQNVNQTNHNVAIRSMIRRAFVFFYHIVCHNLFCYGTLYTHLSFFLSIYSIYHLLSNLAHRPRYSLLKQFDAF